MRRPPRILTTGLVAVALLVGACGGDRGDAIAGTYNCGPEEETGQPPEVWELQEDGTLAINPPEGPQGTWSAEGDSVVVTLEGEEARFTIEGDRLVDVRPPPGGWVCTPA
jgi:hypothetical protein